MLAFYMSMLETEEERLLIEQLYGKYERMMYHSAFDVLHNRQDAEDAVHSAFLQVIKNISKIPGPECPKTRKYLFIIVRNISVNMLARRKKTDYIPIDDAYDVGEDNVELAFSAKTTFEQLNGAFEKLSEQYKQALLLNVFYEKSITEISEMLGIPYDTARKRINRAKQRLLDIMRESDDA